MGQFGVPGESPLSWSHISKLAKLRDDVGQKFGNKLGPQHVQWQKDKMKEQLAAQTFSSSVADVLATLKHIHEDLANIEFIKRVRRGNALFLFCYTLRRLL